jgi:hypothetical protein
MITLISHFYNEEFLLPYWLKHHTKLFDHGVMIDYQSTDRSVEIIRDLVPHWEIRPSHNKDFNAFNLDTEVMDIEQEFKGWKMCLNTTEFLMHHDLRTDVAQFEKRLPRYIGMQTAGIWMVDSPQEFNQLVDDRPLFFQRHHGWFEPVPSSGGSRHRLLHRADNGKYFTGRHCSAHENVIYRPEIFCAWFGWSPYPQVKSRKMQIQTRIPKEHIGTGLGNEHQISSEQMDTNFHIYSNSAVDLLDDHTYKNAIEMMRTHLYPDVKLD